MGLPKTASTFLQHRVFAALSDRQVVLMPEQNYFNSAGDERLLAQIFRRSDTIWKYQADDLLGELFGDGWQEDSRDILLSDEAIGREGSRQGLFGAHLAGMKAALRGGGIERIKLLCLFRRQDHWLISHFVQMSDRGNRNGQADFDALISRISDPRSERYTFGALLDYASTYAACVDALGRDNVTFCPMEWLETEKEAIRSRLAEFLDIAPENLVLDARQRENVRHASNGRWKLRRPRSLRFRILQMLTRRSRHVTLEPSVSRRILEVYRGSNLELAEQTGLDLQALGYFS